MRFEYIGQLPASGFAPFKSLHVVLWILIESLLALLRAEIIGLALPGAAEGSRFLVDPHPAYAIHFFLVCHGSLLLFGY